MEREGSLLMNNGQQMGQTPKRSPFLIRKFDQFSPIEMYSRKHKKLRTNEGRDANSSPRFTCSLFEFQYRKREAVIDYSDPFSIPNLKEELDRDMYGSVTKEIEDLCARKWKMFGPLWEKEPSSRHLDFSPQSPKSSFDTSGMLIGRNREVSQSAEKQSSHLAPQATIDLDDDCVVIDSPTVKDSKPVSKSSATFTQECDGPSIQCVTGTQYASANLKMSNVQIGLQNSSSPSVVILDSDEEDGGQQVPTRNPARYNIVVPHFELQTGSQKQTLQGAAEANRQASYQYQEVFLKKPIGEKQMKDSADKLGQEIIVFKEQTSLIPETETPKDKGVYVGVQDDFGSTRNHQSDAEDDGLEDIWREMNLALEFSKDGESLAVDGSGGEEEEDCDHSFVLKDDLGYVCRICGVIEKSIDTIFDFQWSKGSRTTRTYMSESRNAKDREQTDATFSGLNLQQDLAVADISVHPRHMKQMKSHQLEGFNFLRRNLVADEPGGCILAHAPGSGKTFMIISFIQSYLAKYPYARPLVVLPKGILPTWKREFQKWQIEDYPLYDFYSSKAEKRSDQLEILKEWVEHKGILFLGYKQFANIVWRIQGDKTADACKDILLKVPTILILDEGHTSRTEDTDILSSLANVQTPRKVVLSGTLFQNHVKEVFNILNLVRPKFLELPVPKAIKKRIMSRVDISGVSRYQKTVFFDSVEETLQHDEDFKRKVTVIHDLREMTSNVLHYYKGDFLDELPGLIDLTVLLTLSEKQKHLVEELRKMEKFKRASRGTAVYLHPLLKEFNETSLLGDKGCNFNEDKMDDLLNKMDIKDGVKAKFFLNMLGLCESSGEKLLVFSQFLLPLKFLEKLVVRTRGWRLGKEMFVISGDSNAENREWSMERFNNSSDAKVFFGSIKACGEGISLVGASRVIILDVHLNPSVTRQAIGRAFRPGQTRKVHVYRLVAADSPEEESHNTCFRKELISKMWFEWSECCGHKDFEMETVDAKETGDMFWESPSLGEDVKVLYQR